MGFLVLAPSFKLPQVKTKHQSFMSWFGKAITLWRLNSSYGNSPIKHKYTWHVTKKDVLKGSVPTMVCKLQEKFKTKAACFSCHFGVASRISSYTLGCDPFKTEKKTPRKNFIWVWLYDMKETEQPFKIRNALPFSITTAFFLPFKLERPFTDLLLGEGGIFPF